MIPSQFVISVSLRRNEVPSFENYPFVLPAIRDLERIEVDPRLTFLVGENGSGKSTLMEAIAVSLGFNAEGGSKNFGFSTRTSHSELHKYLRVAKGFKRPKTGYFLRAESFFNVATEIENLDSEPGFSPPVISYYGNRSLHEQSHGESFISLLENRFGADGLYLLDEPEAALSPKRQLIAIKRIHDLIQQSCQFIIATHSPILMSYPGATILKCSESGIEKISYEDTEHYQVMRTFMENPSVRIKEILGDRQ